jgi:hypothetical protein
MMVYRPPALDVLPLEGGRVAEIDSFHFPDLFPAFGPRRGSER